MKFKTITPIFIEEIIDNIILFKEKYNTSPKLIEKLFNRWIEKNIEIQYLSIKDGKTLFFINF